MPPGGASSISSRPSSLQSVGKRASLTMSSLALLGGAADPLAQVFALKSLGAVAPEKALQQGNYGRLSSIGLVHHPLFTAGGCYVVNSKANTFAILQVSYCRL